MYSICPGLLFCRVWSVRYNHFHDQLVLTSSSDSRVVLNNLTSISSEPFGHLVEDEELDLDDENGRERYGISCSVESFPKDCPIG